MRLKRLSVSVDLRLQNFAGEHGPVWAQAIGVIDAAQMLADLPTEGVDHEMYNAPSSPAAKQSGARKG